MQIWGPGPFDSNAALAFCNALADHPDPLAYLRETLAQAAQGPLCGSGAVKAGCRTVAAAHLLALELGFGEATPPEDSKPPLWAISRKDAEALRPLAAKALDRLLNAGSDLRGRWQEQGEAGDAWVASVARLQLHLEAPAETPPPPRPFWE